MKMFILNRLIDDSGVSGTGIIAEGVQFDDGRCVLRWKTSKSSIAIYNNIQDLKDIHGHGNHTIIIFKNDLDNSILST
jgi:hypothetical protein